jgi:intein/homing endonuclease
MGVKYKVNENFFKTWSRSSSYVLGILFADGSLENAPYIRGEYVRLTSTDLSLIEQVKKALNSQHKIVTIPSSGNRKEKYLLRIGSHKIYNDLENLGLYPRKSLDMELPHIPYRFLSDFVRGYFDGDGCIALEKTKNKPHNRLKAIFTSGSKNFLDSLSKILKQRCTGKIGKIYDSHRSYQLVYNSVDAAKLLEFMYNKAWERKLLYLDRKYLKYKELFYAPETFRCGNLFDRQSRVWN